MTVDSEDSVFYQQVVCAASEAYQRHKEWRASKTRHDLDCEQSGPTPTGSDVIDWSIGVQPGERGTPEQEHLWVVLADKAIDLADDRKQQQPPRMTSK